MLPLLMDDTDNILDDTIDVSGNDVSATETSTFNLPQQAGSVHFDSNDTISLQKR
jgi:hypothetical protein